MTEKDVTFLPRRRLGGFCLIYGLLMLYSSTVIGPAGPNPVWIDPADAFRRLLATPFVVHGSDQRADWIGNLLMLVPFGFLVTGAVWPRQPAFKVPAAAGAMLTCLLTIVAIKYLQLFFPPRTVTLNYIIAQSLGAVIGCGCFALVHERFGRLIQGGDPAACLMLALRLYFISLLIFTLMPLDFALDATDLRAQIDRLPETLQALPGANRPLAQRVIVVLAATAAYVPVGMLLAFVRRGAGYTRRSMLAVAGHGLLVTTGIFLLSAMVISAFPIMSSILFRTCGIMAGAAMVGWLSEQKPSVLKRRLCQMVPWAVLPYLACLLVANRLLSTRWLSFHAAVAQAYPLGFLPLFDYYIVTKAAAAKNIIGHMVLYMPIGVLLWLRYGERGSAWSFNAAAAVSAVAEAGRYFRPGQEGDINAIVVAGISAMLAARLMPMVWSMLEALGSHSASASGQHWNRCRMNGQPAGKIGQL